MLSGAFEVLTGEVIFKARELNAIAGTEVALDMMLTIRIKSSPQLEGCDKGSRPPPLT